MEKLLTVREVAQKLDLSVGRVYQLAKHQDFPTIRIGGSIRVNAAHLQAWIDSNRKKICGDDK